MGNLGGISAFPSTCHLRIAYFLDQLPHRTCLKKREIGFKCKEEMGIPNNCIAFDFFYTYIQSKLNYKFSSRLTSKQHPLSYLVISNLKNNRVYFSRNNRIITSLSPVITTRLKLDYTN